MHTFISIYKKLVPCHVRTDHPNKALKQRKAIRLKQTSRQTCITHKVMFSSIPRETYFKYFFFFQTNVFCLAFKLILLGYHLSCFTALMLASHALKELWGIHAFVLYDSHKDVCILSWGLPLSQWIPAAASCSLHHVKQQRLPYRYSSGSF